MLPANVMGVGMHLSPVILPALPLGIPTPGVTMGMHAMAVPPCPTILFTCQPALNMGSTVPVAPNIPPILIPPVLPQLNVIGIFTILLTCLPATSLTMPAVSAGPPGLTAVPDVTLVMHMYAGPLETETASGYPRVTVEDLRALVRSLSGPMVDSALMAESVGYVSIRKFSSSVPSAVFHAVEALTARGMTSLIIDLRGNGGGEMDAFLQLAGDFLEEDSLLVTMTDSDGDETEHRTRHSRRYSFPVAVLVDAGTASAAEVFAGSLQAHGRAVVVGERTYGKAEAWAVVPSPDGLIYGKVATAALPDGRSLQGTGLEPDLSWAGGHGASGSAVASEHRLTPALHDAISVCLAPPPLASGGTTV